MRTGQGIACPIPMALAHYITPLPFKAASSGPRTGPAPPSRRPRTAAPMWPRRSPFSGLTLGSPVFDSGAG